MPRARRLREHDRRSGDRHRGDEHDLLPGRRRGRRRGDSRSHQQREQSTRDGGGGDGHPPPVRRAGNAKRVGVGLLHGRRLLLDEEPLLGALQRAPGLTAQLLDGLGVCPLVRQKAAHTFNRGARPMSAPIVKRASVRRFKTPQRPSRAAAGPTPPPSRRRQLHTVVRLLKAAAVAPPAARALIVRVHWDYRHLAVRAQRREIGLAALRLLLLRPFSILVAALPRPQIFHRRNAEDAEEALCGE